jgi:hypothetical protein
MIQFITRKRKPVVDWCFSCGRAFLLVNGCAIVMEGDKLRDDDLAKVGEKLIRKKWKDEPAVLASYRLDEGGLTVWTEDLIKYVAAKANGGKLP